MAKPTLTPRQLQAKAVYNKAFKRALFLTLLIFFALEIVLIIAIFQLTSPVAPFPGWLLSMTTVPIFLVSHARAVGAVRRAGLLDENTEVVARTATTFEGEDLAFQYPSSPLGKVALIASGSALTLMMGWLCFYSANDFAETAIGAVGLVLFSCATLALVATVHQPNASLDERGVFGYRHSFIPTLVRWPEIDSAHFYRLTSFQSGADAHTVTLKNARGETLLVLNPNTFMGSPAQWQQQFIAELKRRLIAATPPAMVSQREENRDD